MRVFAKDTEPTHLPTTTGHSFVMLIATLLLVSSTFGPSLVPATFQIWELGPPTWSPTPLDAARDGLILTAISLAAAFVLYASHPLWTRRSFGHAEPLDSASALAKMITDRASQAGIIQPNMLVDNDIRNRDAITFGIGSQKTILLGRGLLRLAHIKPQSIDAKICHEIGHIYNKDISKKYFGEASIITIILILVYSLLIYLIKSANIFVVSTKSDIQNGVSMIDILVNWKPFFADIAYRSFLLLLKSAFIVTILISIHRLFIRSREHYADRISAVFCSGTQLKDIFSRADYELNHGRAFSFHPSPASRISFLDNVGLFYIASVPSVFLTGFILGMQSYLVYTAPTSKYVEQFTGLKQYLLHSLTHIEGFYLYLFVSAQFAPILILLVALLFHLSNNIILSENRLKAMAYTFVIFCVFYFSMFMGAYYNPFIFEARLQNNMNPFTTYPASDFDLSFQSITMFGALSSVSLLLILKRLYTSRKTRKPNPFTWILIAFFFSQFINFMMYAFFYVIGHDTNSNGAVDWATAGAALVYGLLFYIFAYVLARRSLRIGLVPSDQIAPWMKTLRTETGPDEIKQPAEPYLAT